MRVCRQISTTGLFFCGIILLIVYLCSMRWNMALPISMFWLSFGLVISSIILQIFYIKSFDIRIMLLELSVLSIALHLIYQIPYSGLYGSDIYFDLASTKGILTSGFIRGSETLINNTAYWPIIHIYGVVCSDVTGCGIKMIAKWLPSFIGVIPILMLYLLVKQLFKVDSIAILSTLLFVCLQHHILFSSLFIRETVALVSAICCVYLYFTAKRSSRPIIYLVLAILFLIVTILAHHLTSFMLVLFFLLHFIVSWCFERYANNNHNIVIVSPITLSFLLLAFVLTFSYWVYVINTPLYTLALFIKDLLTPGAWFAGTYSQVADMTYSSIPSLRGRIIFFGFYFFNFIFAAILLYNLRPQKFVRVENYSFTLYLFLCGLVGFLSLYFIKVRAYPDRFLMFGWLFGFAPLVFAIMSFIKERHKKLGIALLLMFMFFNIYTIEPTAWDTKSRNRGYVPATTQEDYSFAETLDFSKGKVLTTYVNQSMVIYDIYNKRVDGLASLNDDAGLLDYDYIIVQKYRFKDIKESSRKISKIKKVSNQSDWGWNTVYESKSLATYVKIDN
jgi:uncharacterized membrane protein